jgi:NTP pyrophosphatase (non-canonical NTP hydrolase)
MEHPIIKTTDLMTFDGYQKETAKTAVYAGQGTFIGLEYVALKGAGEAGEFAEKVGKAIRDDGIIEMTSGFNADGKRIVLVGQLSEERRLMLIAELGDQLWYLARKAAELDVLLSDVAISNINKLKDRQARGTLQGNGDTR